METIQIYFVGVIMNETIRQLNERKSVRVFTGEHIPEEDVRIIAEAAAQAPTAGNQQLYTILDITDQALKAFSYYGITHCTVVTE